MQYIRFAEGTKFPDQEKAVSDSHENFSDAGFLLPEDIVVVDIDKLEQEQLEALNSFLRTDTQTVTTDRGVHYYYRIHKGEKFPSEFICHLGFPIEIKTKLITIKRNGVHRTVENKDVYKELPWFFRPCKEQSALGLVDGDGRHNVLFKYKLINHKRAECNEILTFINDHIFAEPKDDRHMERLMEQSIRFDPEVAGDRVRWVMLETNPVRWNSTIFYQIDGNYTCDTYDIKRKIDMLMPDLPTAAWEEMLKKIEVRAKVIDDNTILPIVLNNGYLYKGRFIKGSYDGFSPYVIDRDYVANAPRPACQDGFLENALGGDRELEKYLFQMFGASFIVEQKYRAADPRIHFIVGDGGNAKGTLVKKGGNLFGAKNRGTSKPHDFEDQQKLIAIKNKLICIGEDVKDKAINADIMERLKNVSAADEITLRQLYSAAEDGVVICTKLIFTTNHVLSSFEKGESWRRRAKWIHFEKKFEMPDEWWDEWHSPNVNDYWFCRMIEEYMELYANKGKFMPCKAVDRFSEAYHDDNDTVLQFLSYYDEDTKSTKKRPADDFLCRTPGEVYTEFTTYCLTVHAMDKPPTSPKPFSSRLMSEYNMKSQSRRVNGVSTRIYLKNNT